MAKTQSNTAVATRPVTALERPAFIKEGDVRGSENIGSNDIRPPALRIAQAMSPEVKRSEPAYVDGLREGDLFNSITKEIYGEGPIGLVVVNQLGHRNVEFAPLSEGGGVVDFNVPDGDARTQFTEQVVDGVTKRVKPRATLFYDYLVLAILEDGRRVLTTLSMKSTQIKKAKVLNTLIKTAKVPSFALQFTARPVSEKKGTYSYYGWRIDPAGYVSEEVFKEAETIYDSLVGKTVTIETEEVADEVENTDEL